ncbi:DNA polymerase Y family protein [Rubritalea sp.]|uniref:DNA polymerase Y family protein n=1 Tax=Rubritalea sp. TaxID=2109375 RepID=UPI003EFA24A0
MSLLPLAALFLDFDSYFASVEQHLQPHLRGRPIGVAPVMAETSCCIAASYQAKEFGVKTGTPIREARQLCPSITIVPARPELYVEYHHKLVAAIESCIHVEAVLSIDELWCWLPYNWRESTFLEELGQNIKMAIADQVSPIITCTIGIASNRWLAKMASKMRKPDGILILEQKSLPEALYPLKLSDLTGIGRSMELRLHARGLHSVEQICAASRETLHSIWGGIEGDRFWMNLHGVTLPELETTRRTIGHSHVLPPTMRKPDAALPIAHKLTQKAAIRLRKENLLAGALHLQLRYLHDKQSWAAEMRFEHSNDSLHFSKVLHSLWKKRPWHQAKLLQVGMQLSHLLEQTNYTPSLFSREQPERENLNQALDSIRRKHGQKSIHLGCEQDGMSAAPMRISFTHIPDVESENR